MSATTVAQFLASDTAEARLYHLESRVSYLEAQLLSLQARLSPVTPGPYFGPQQPHIITSAFPADPKASSS